MVTVSSLSSFFSNSRKMYNFNYFFSFSYKLIFGLISVRIKFLEKFKTFCRNIYDELHIFDNCRYSLMKFKKCGRNAVLNFKKNHSNLPPL